jgi:hypothetical protein
VCDGGGDGSWEHGFEGRIAWSGLRRATALGEGVAG